MSLSDADIGFLIDSLPREAYDFFRKHGNSPNRTIALHGLENGFKDHDAHQLFLADFYKVEYMGQPDGYALLVRKPLGERAWGVMEQRFAKMKDMGMIDPCPIEKAAMEEVEIFGIF